MDSVINQLPGWLIISALLIGFFIIFMVGLVFIWIVWNLGEDLKRNVSRTVAVSDWYEDIGEPLTFKEKRYLFRSQLFSTSQWVTYYSKDRKKKRTYLIVQKRWESDYGFE